MSDPHPYHRPNVGVVLFNAEGRVWLGKGLQFPGPWNPRVTQGGLVFCAQLRLRAPLPPPARRELEEETGARSTEYLGRTDGWIVYDFPDEVLARGGKWRGQKQVWFAFRFTGDEAEFRLDGHHQVEFEDWRWARLDEAPELIVPFKRAAYEQVAQAFRPYAGP